MLSVKQVSYQNEKRGLFANMDWQANPGDIIQLHGENGSGKSTLLKMIAGFVRPSSGCILWHELPVWKHLVPCYVAHELGLSESLTVAENLQWMASLHRFSLSTEQQDTILTRIGLLAYQHCHPTDLSRGMRQRLALAPLILSQSALWLLDEPATGLDQMGIQLLMALLASFQAKRGITVLTSHQALPVEGVRSLDFSQWQGFNHKLGKARW